MEFQPAKFKPGDKIIVSSQLMTNDSCISPGWDQEMLQFCDRPVTISCTHFHYSGSQGYYIIEDHRKWIYVERWMTHLTTVVEKKDIRQLLSL